ncbi:DNA binding protein [Oceanobacter kriegii]|uniref:DNA binding protein n=1 Tax=Oceanobacter kriegii TaxID=64972 RepID=UPI000418E605|nr:DNA binding protein [Oceanobacter kriegii]
MSILDTDIEKQIQQHQQKIMELEQLKKDHEKKLEGLKQFDAEIKRLCEERSLTEDELYVSRSEQIEKWITDMAKQEAPSAIYNSLRKHFEKAANRAAKGGKKAVAANKPKLEVGEYTNPNTGETVEKIKRNPRQLDQWIAEHGIETVKGWKS